MIFVTYKDNGNGDILDVTSYFYSKEDAKEYSELMGQRYMGIPNISREYWPEKVKYVYCSAWPTSNNISTDIREYEILSDEIKDIKTELIVRPNSVCKCFFCPKEEAQEEFNNILNEYKSILRPNQYGGLQNQLVRKDLEGLLQKTVNGQECWGTQEEWDSYNAYLEAYEKSKKSGPSDILTSGGWRIGTPVNYATVSAPITFSNALNIRSTPNAQYNLYNTYTNSAASNNPFSFANERITALQLDMEGSG